MTHRPSRHRRPACEVLEARDQPGIFDFASAVASSPVFGAARAVMLGYKAGQLAWTGHTSVLFGKVRISQPFALANARLPRLPVHAISMPHGHHGHHH